MRLTSLTAIAALALTLPAHAEPDGQIAYTSFQQIHVMNPDGSGRRALTEGQTPAWSPDGERILFQRFNPSSIWVMNRDGSDIQMLFQAEGIGYPSFSHDGQRVLFHWHRDGESFIYSVDAVPGAEPQLIPLFPSNPDDATLHAEPAPSPDGRTLAFIVSRPSRYGTRNVSHLFLAGMDGSNIRLIAGEIGTHDRPAWSSDGSRLAFYSRRQDGEGIYVADSEGQNQTLLSVEWVIDWSPTWSPDNEWVAFVSNQSRVTADIFIMRADGTDVRNLTDSGDSQEGDPAWSPVPLPPLPTAVAETSWGQIKSRD